MLPRMKTRAVSNLTFVVSTPRRRVIRVSSLIRLPRKSGSCWTKESRFARESRELARMIFFPRNFFASIRVIRG